MVFVAVVASSTAAEEAMTACSGCNIHGIPLASLALSLFTDANDKWYKTSAAVASFACKVYRCSGWQFSV